jgi:RimJ/RimL family protein N-acetyltransferase
MISTERLVIRPFKESDYADLYEYLSLEETYRFEPGKPVSLEEAKNLASERAKGTNFWAVTLKNGDNKLIGHVSLFEAEPVFKTREIGYIFNPVYQNKGYATEATAAIIKYAFEKLNTHRVVAYCSPDNTPSWKVLEKCGMKREGLYRKNAFFRKDDAGNPIWFDSCIYAILAEDLK